MFNYLPYIFGIPFFLFGLYLFLLSFRLYKPKYKDEKKEEQYRKLLEKRGALLKVCSIALLLNGSYDLIMRNPERYRIGSGNSHTEWTAADKEIFVKNCMRDAGPTAASHPQLIKEYCSCSVDRIMNAMTRDQYAKSLSKPQEQQLKEILPIFQDCLDELKQRMDSLNKQK